MWGEVGTFSDVDDYIFCHLLRYSECSYHDTSYVIGALHYFIYLGSLFIFTWLEDIFTHYCRNFVMFLDVRTTVKDNLHQNLV